MRGNALILDIGPSPLLAAMTGYIHISQLSWTLKSYKVELLGNLPQHKPVKVDEETDYMGLEPTNRRRRPSRHLKK